MNNLKTLRKQKGLTQKDLAQVINSAQNTISNWENGTRDIDSETLKAFANFFEVSVDYILGRPNTKPANADIIRVPIYGTIPAGIPIEAIENIEDYEEIPASWSNGGKEYFGLKVKGDSMSPAYLDGDTIIFLKTPDCESGQDCCVMVNGSDSTFKRVFKKTIGITLQPLNPAYEAYFYTNEEIENLPVTIVGKVKELRRQIG